MSHNRHVHFWLIAAFAASSAVTLCGARPATPHPVRFSVASTFASGLTTQVRIVVPSGRTMPPPRPLMPFVLSQPLRDSIVAIALLQLGTPYVFGGATPNRGFDCSGLVRYALAQVHVGVPRTALRQSMVGTPVERDALVSGDLIAFGDGPQVTHIGIYVGQGQFVHASSVAGRVIVSSLDRPTSRLILPMKGARRLLLRGEAL